VLLAWSIQNGTEGHPTKERTERHSHDGQELASHWSPRKTKLSLVRNQM
jgi:hypothetical protein